MDDRDDQRVVRPRAELLAELRRLVDGVERDAPIVVHSDFRRIGMPEGAGAAIGRIWLDLLREMADPRPLLIPTFNYDFCTSGRFDPLADHSQVGALGRFCSMHHPESRTRTPVFNFCIFDNDRFDPSPETEPFGAGGIFAELEARNAAILFLGVGLGANTFVHRVEEAAGIGYRYMKRFRGVLVEGRRERPVDLAYRVRPLVSDAVEYGDLGEALVDAAGRLRRVPVGLGTGLAVRARDYAALVGDAIRADELHLLTPRSRAWTERLFAEFGRPLTIARMEGAAPLSI
jgi:aminoglycoside 3-N-acetyltransferase